MSDELVELRDGEGVQTWAMNAAPVNAIGPEFLAALEARLAAAVADESVSVVVLTSDLKVFSAGADASWMASVVAADGVDGLLEQFNRTMDRFRELCVAIRRSPLLFVAALNGHTLAGGLELAAACDLRFASDRERLQIGAPEMDLFGAMPTGGGGAQFLARLMGPSSALRFILDAKPVGPQEALRLGLVDGLHPPDEMLAAVEAFAADVARKAGRVGVSAAKRSILGGAELPLYDALELDRSLHWDSMRRGNFKAGVTAFVERFG
jgi:enoyl-CoA hydratase/carnithine racemase